MTPNHNGSKQGHSAATAKASMDLNIIHMREKQLATGVVTTDLSAPYDTWDSNLLSNKLEHIGV